MKILYLIFCVALSANAQQINTLLRFTTEGYQSDAELINELETMITIAKKQ